MRFRPRLRTVPPRLATGAYILHTGLGKWHGDENLAVALHTSSSTALPVLKPIKPTRFLRLLAAGEITTGSLLLTPLVPPLVAGGALTLFSGSLIAMYLRTPAMHLPGSVWPTPQGTAVSKDCWMLGIGLGLLVDALTDRG